MSFINKTLWSTEGRIKARDIVVMVAEITEVSVSICEETITSSQQVSCSNDKLKEVLNVRTDEELMHELEQRFGTVYGYEDARKFMEENGIEFHWWGGSN